MFVLRHDLVMSFVVKKERKVWKKVERCRVRSTDGQKKDWFFFLTDSRGKWTDLDVLKRSTKARQCDEGRYSRCSFGSVVVVAFVIAQEFLVAPLVARSEEDTLTVLRTDVSARTRG